MCAHNQSPSAANSTREFVLRHFRFNFTAALVDAVGWPLGMSIISAATILPLFVRSLGGSNLEVGLIPALSSMGFLLPQLLTAGYVQRMRIHRRYVLLVAMVERAFLAALVPLILLWYTSNPRMLLVAFFVAYAAHSIAMGCNNPAYTALISKLIPADRRGRLYGVGGTVGGILGLGGAFLARQVLQYYGLRIGFTLCFALALFVLVVTVIPLGFMREYPQNPPHEDGSLGKQFRRIVGIVRRDVHFARFLLSQVLQSFSVMAGAFYTVYAIQRFHVGSAEVGTYTVVLQAAGTASGLLWGYAADHKGNRWLLIVGSVLMAVTPLAALWVPSRELYPAVFLLSGLAVNAYELAIFNIVMEFCPPSDVPAYAALRATVVAPFRTLAPVVGGILADEVGYAAVFVLSAGAALLGLPLVIAMKEPRHERECLMSGADFDVSEREAVGK
jgi:MFS family permease